MTSISYSSLLQAQTGGSELPVSAYECTQVSINDIDESLLTREERIARMDSSLSESIDSYTSCVNTVQNEMSGGGSGAGSAAGVTDSSDQGSANGAGQQAAQPNESAQTDQANQDSGASQGGSAPVSTQSSSSSNTQRGVIAPKDNDSIICKLLYDEIQKNTGGSLAGLEKQYRDYKCGN